MMQLMFSSFNQVKIKHFGDKSLIFFDTDNFYKAYKNGDIHPVYLKKNLIKYINLLIKPVHNYFINNPYIKELLEQVIQYKIQ